MAMDPMVALNHARTIATEPEFAMRATAADGDLARACGALFAAVGGLTIELVGLDLDPAPEVPGNGFGAIAAVGCAILEAYWSESDTARFGDVWDVVLEDFLGRPERELWAGKDWPLERWLGGLQGAAGRAASFAQIAAKNSRMRTDCISAVFQVTLDALRAFAAHGADVSVELEP